MKEEDWDAEIGEEPAATDGSHRSCSQTVSVEKSGGPIKSFGRGQWYDEDGGSGPGQGTRSIGRGFRSHDSVVVGANEKNSYSHSKTENGHKEKLSSADDCGWDETPDVEQSESNFSDNTDKFRSNKPYRNNRNGDYRGRGGRFDNNSLNERSGIEQSENRFSDTNRFGSSNRPYRNNENYDYRGRGGRFDSRGNGNSKYHGETRDEGKENWNRDFESGDRGGRGNSRGRRGGGGRGRGGSFGGDDDIPSGGGFRRGGGPSVRGGRRVNRNGDDTSTGVNGDEKPRAPPYVPPSLPDDEASLFDSIPSGINFDKYKDVRGNVSGHDAPNPINSFEESSLRTILKENIKRSGYNIPTPVQKYAIPIIMAGRDLMACAQTGSGKTAAFILPVLHNLLEEGMESASLKQCQEPYVVIMSPTRELASQIFAESRKFSYGSIIKSKILYGGTSVRHQLENLDAGCHLLVATPGRLLDVVNRSKVSFTNVRYLILDEADKMLDMGFLSDIQKIITNPSMPPKGERRTLMFSATFPEQIQRLAKDYLEDYLFLTIGLIGGANSDVKQEFRKVPAFDKRKELLELLKTGERAMVFIQLKRNADFLASYLSQNGFMSTSIHGDRYQSQREEALRDFKTGKMPVLVATAVASRGLDIKDVGHVINYDLPVTIEEYVHRIGRTGRVGNIGRATSFYDPTTDQPLAREFVKTLSDAQQEVPEWLLEEANSAVGTSVYSTGGRYGTSDIRSYKEFRRNNTADEYWENKTSDRQKSNPQMLDEGECWD